MGDFAIKAEGIGKKYRIGHRKSGDLRESFGNFLSRFKSNNPNSPNPPAFGGTGQPLTPDTHITTSKTSTLFSNSESSNEFWALKDISFEIKQGEAVGIIGRNGAGKSTLLKILSRITEPTTGKFWINGKVSSLLEVGTGFHPELTGRENIFLNGTILGMKRKEIKNKFDEIVDFSGVEQFIDTPVKHYSSGMKVRLAFSVAAHLEPEILLIDEVLAVGDAEFQKKCLGKMEDVTGDGRTVIFVSHNMEAVEILCDRGIVLDKGFSLFDGVQSDAIKNYYFEQSRLININLSSRNDRIGSQKVIVKNIEYCNDPSFNHPHAITGQPLFIRLHYIKKEEIQNQRLIASILLKTLNNQSLILLHNRMTGDFFENLSNEGNIVCKIEKLSLLPGRYKLTYSLIIDGEYLDGINDVIYIDIEAGDFFGTGELPLKKQSLITTDCKWYIEN